MSTVLTKAVVSTTTPPSGASVLPRYPNGLSGLQNGSVTLGTVTPSNGGAIDAGVQRVATVKKYGPALTETVGPLVDKTQHAATILVCDSTAMTADKANQVKNTQNYGPGETKHAVESAGSGQNGTTATVGLGGALFGQPAGYSIKS